MCMDAPVTRSVLSRMIKSVLWASAATLPLLAANAAQAQQSFDALKGGARMSAAQTRAAGTLKGLRALRTDAAGIPAQIEADLGVMGRSDASFDADSRALLRRLSVLYKADGTESLQFRKSSRAGTRRHVRAQQLIDGLEVIGADAVLHVDELSNRVTEIDSNFLSGAALPRAEKISAKDAYAQAFEQLAKPGTARITAGPRLAFARKPDATGYLVFDADVEYVDAEGSTHIDRLLLDTQTGAVVWRIPRLHDALNRRIRNYNTSAIIVDEGSSTTDSHAMALYNILGQTYNYYLNTFQRDSYNNLGSRMTAYVHGTPYGQNNAASNGGGTLYFGDGDGSRFGNFGRSIDVVAHEWTHSVTGSEANLVYEGESGGLNEAYSDIFGAAVEASVNGISGNTWLLGETIYTPGTPGDALRYMGDPARDGNSRDIWTSTVGSANVHYSSGVANLAFYLLVNGGSHPRGKTTTSVTGISMAQAHRIFYITLRDRLLSSDGYSAMRNKTAQTARAEFGANSQQLASVCQAWDAVAVPNNGSQCPTQ